MITTDNPDELIPLIELIKEGDFYAVIEWINLEKPIFCKRSKRHSVLRYAVKTGFLSIVQLLLKEDWSTEKEELRLCMNNALAIRSARITEELINSGFDTNLISWDEILYTGSDKILSIFFYHSKDLNVPYKLGDFIASYCYKNLLKVYKKFLPKQPDLFNHLQHALCDAMHNNNLRCLHLLVFAGADPRKEYFYDGIKYSSPLVRAVEYELYLCLKAFKPNVNDDVNKLIDYVGSFYAVDLKIVSLLVELGAKLNNKPNGGSRLLDNCFLFINLIPKTYTDEFAIKSIIKKGAILKPDDNYSFRMIRDWLCNKTTKNPYEIICLLAEATDYRIVEKILTPRITKLLGRDKNEVLKKLYC